MEVGATVEVILIVAAEDGVEAAAEVSPAVEDGAEAAVDFPAAAHQGVGNENHA